VVQADSETRMAREKRLAWDIFMVTPLHILGVIALANKF